MFKKEPQIKMKRNVKKGYHSEMVCCIVIGSMVHGGQKVTVLLINDIDFLSI